MHIVKTKPGTRVRLTGPLALTGLLTAMLLFKATPPAASGAVGDRQQCSALVPAFQHSLQIGTSSGASDYIFTRIVGVARLRSGLIVVADSRPTSVRLYGPQGDFQREITRTGTGPGELPSITTLLVNANEIWASASTPPITQVYDHGGNYLRTLRSAPPAALLNDGSYALAELQKRTEPQRARDLSTDTMAITLVHATGSSEKVAEFPGIVFVGTSNGAMRPQEFGPDLMLTARDSSFYVAWGQSPVIAVFDRNGQVIRRVTFPGARRALTVDDQETFTRRILTPGTELSGAAAARDRASREDIAANMVFPEYHPYFSSILVDPAGCIWAKEPPAAIGGADQSAAYLIVGPEGSAAGRVTLPARFAPYEIGADYVIGVWRDEDDVQYVRVYGLNRE